MAAAADYTPTLAGVDDLSNWLKQDADNDAGALALIVAEGWLQLATQLPSWPKPLPMILFAWDVELAGLIYANPKALTNRVIGGTAEANAAAARKDEILTAAERYYGNSGRPLGSFPNGMVWPDPVERYGFPSWFPWIRLPGYSGLVNLDDGFDGNVNGDQPPFALPARP